MKLTIKDIKNVTYGACFFRETPEGLCFDRFTEDQKESFRKPGKYYNYDPVYDEYFVENCRTNPNVMIDFTTDSEKVVIDIGKIENINGSARNSVEVLKNGKRVTVTEDAKTVAVSNARGAARYTVLFPYFGEAAIKGIYIDDGCEIKPARSRRLWLMLGDSITHGVGASAPSRSYAVRSAMKFDGEVISQASSGYIHDYSTIAPVSDLRTGKIRTPDFITSAYGINDFGRKQYDDNYSDTLKYYETLIDVFPKSKIIMIAPIWTTFFENNMETCERMYTIFKDISHKLGIPMINGIKLVPNSGLYFVDGLHPNDNGHSYYSQRLLKELKNIISF